MSEEELETLFKKHMKLARVTVYKVFPKPKYTARRKGLDLEDIYQYAYTGLWKACISYDPAKGTSFRTHAINHIRWHLIEKAKREGNPLKYDANKEIKFEDMPRINSLDKTVSHIKNGGRHGTDVTLHDIYPSHVNLEWEALDNLTVSNLLGLAVTSDEVEVIKLRMKELTYDEIGQRYGCTGENVRAKIRKLKSRMKQQIQKEALV